MTAAGAESLAASYERCRQLHRRHGRSYYLATRLLPAWKRRHVHALYGFARYADEIVDQTGALPVAERAARLTAWSARFLAGLGGAPTEDPLLPAVLHTIGVFGLDLADFDNFLASMTMDLTVTGYATYDDLLRYMDGSAAAIGTMMLPILGLARPADARSPSTTGDDPAAAREAARQLGLAFQLTNFIRDVAEDLDLGRVYLPVEDLDRFGVSTADLIAARDAGGLGVAGTARPAVVDPRTAGPARVDPRTAAAIRELIAFEVQRARGHYALAAPGVTMLAPASQACVRAAYNLYGGILDAIWKLDFDVFGQRARVPRPRRLRTALAAVTTPTGTPVPVPGHDLDAARFPQARAALARPAGAVGGRR
ncbi:MAG: 15-cis-phytoene synthase [Micromonosporaceae bacterium]|jgi:phytoene synthase|nr:15-cis-phytoene synthase [Micromonosporaceae bacterium]